MIGFSRRQRSGWPRVLALAVGMGLAGGIVSARSGAMPRHFGRRPTRVVTVREVIIRREPGRGREARGRGGTREAGPGRRGWMIHAVTLAQLRQELRRARLAQAGYERQIAGQYQTIQRLQSQLHARLRELGQADARRASQHDGQFEIILQALTLVIFAIIGSLLLALVSSYSRDAREADCSAPRLPAADWGPLQHRLREAKDALAMVEARLRRLEMDASH